MRTQIIKLIIFLIAISLHLSTELNAQGRSQVRPSRNGEVPSQNRGAAGVPIDGGASALLVAGAAYGLKKLIDSRRKRKEIE
ncbi:PID-CTERM protein-sorting domain-containing protein [Pontibacter ramchanderi]|uniref:PID-CTERM protein-sorting domain-containing protein n=1 Tax=Pontibacter ramchanderi TaxID=1179743 RepID=UPI000C6FFA69